MTRPVDTPDRFSRRERGGDSEASRTRRRGPISLTDLVTEFAREHRLRRPDDRERVFSAWKRVAGADLSRVAWPARWRDGELLVEVSSAPHLHELSAFRSTELIGGLNQALGRDMVRRLVFKPGVRP